MPAELLCPPRVRQHKSADLLTLQVGAVLICLVLGCTKIAPAGAQTPWTRKGPGSAVEAELRESFSKAYDIRSVEIHRGDPRKRAKLCWKASERLDAFADIQQYLADFQGHSRWLISPGSNGIYCIISLKPTLAVEVAVTPALQPQIAQPDSEPGPTESLAESSASDNEFRSLLRFLVRRISENHDRREPAQRRNPRMHQIWVVKDPNKFADTLQATSQTDHRLEYELSYPEWKALYIDVLLADTSRGGREIPPDGIISEFNEDIAGFPLLSRINGIMSDAMFEADEVTALQQECLRASANTGNKEARKALDKLLRICDEASRSGLGIFFLAP